MTLTLAPLLWRGSFFGALGFVVCVPLKTASPLSYTTPKDTMRRCFNTLAAQTEKMLAEDPYSGHLFAFSGRWGDLLKIICWVTQGACLFMKCLEKGRFVWPAAKDGKVCVTAAQLSMLLEGIDWRMPQRTWRPLKAGYSQSHRSGSSRLKWPAWSRYWPHPPQRSRPE